MSNKPVYINFGRYSRTKGEKGKKEGLVLKEATPGWTVDDIITITGVPMETAGDFQVYQL